MCVCSTGCCVVMMPSSMCVLQHGVCRMQGRYRDFSPCQHCLHIAEHAPSAHCAQPLAYCCSCLCGLQYWLLCFCRVAAALAERVAVARSAAACLMSPLPSRTAPLAAACLCRMVAALAHFSPTLAWCYCCGRSLLALLLLQCQAQRFFPWKVPGKRSECAREAPGRHPGGVREASGRRPGGAREAPGRSPGMRRRSA